MPKGIFLNINRANWANWPNQSYSADSIFSFFYASAGVSEKASPDDLVDAIDARPGNYKYQGYHCGQDHVKIYNVIHCRLDSECSENNRT